MQVTARVDYAVRALVELAAAPDQRLSRNDLAAAQQIPTRYLEVVLAQLRQAGLIRAQRGATGGYVLGRPADQITIADISRAVDGPLTLVQGLRPEDVVYEGAAEHLSQLWVGLRAAMRSVLESVSVGDVLRGEWPAAIGTLIEDPDAWRPR